MIKGRAAKMPFNLYPVLVLGLMETHGHVLFIGASIHSAFLKNYNNESESSRYITVIFVAE